MMMMARAPRSRARRAGGRHPISATSIRSLLVAESRARVVERQEEEQRLSVVRQTAAAEAIRDRQAREAALAAQQQEQQQAEVQVIKIEEELEPTPTQERREEKKQQHRPSLQQQRPQQRVQVEEVAQEVEEHKEVRRSSRAAAATATAAMAAAFGVGPQPTTKRPAAPPGARRSLRHAAVGQSREQEEEEQPGAAIQPTRVQVVEIHEALKDAGKQRLANLFKFPHMGIGQEHLEDHPLLMATAPDGQRLLNLKSLLECCQLDGEQEDVKRELDNLKSFEVNVPSSPAWRQFRPFGKFVGRADFQILMNGLGEWYMAQGEERPVLEACVEHMDELAEVLFAPPPQRDEEQEEEGNENNEGEEENEDEDEDEDEDMPEENDEDTEWSEGASGRAAAAAMRRHSSRSIVPRTPRRRSPRVMTFSASQPTAMAPATPIPAATRKRARSLSPPATAASGRVVAVRDFIDLTQDRRQRRRDQSGRFTPAPPPLEAAPAQVAAPSSLDLAPPSPSLSAVASISVASPARSLAGVVSHEVAPAPEGSRAVAEGGGGDDLPAAAPASPPASAAPPVAPIVAPSARAASAAQSIVVSTAGDPAAGAAAPAAAAAASALPPRSSLSACLPPLESATAILMQQIQSLRAHQHDDADIAEYVPALSAQAEYVQRKIKHAAELAAKIQGAAFQ